MKRIVSGAIVICGLMAFGQAHASGAFTGRVGLSAGSYKQDETFVDQAGCCGPAGATYTGDYSSGQYGVLGGLGLNVARFFADVGLEYLKYAKDRDTDFDGVEDTAYYRSDLLLTLGAFIGDRWTVFAGYRHATLGDGFFSEDLGYTQAGPFLGGGVSFRAGKKLSLGASAAYNVLTYSYDGTAYEEVDLNGLSVKLQMSFLRTPHAVFLRWQRFDGDESEPGFYDYESTEDYVNVGYQATFDFTSW